jgi:hypothetical protein
VGAAVAVAAAASGEPVVRSSARIGERLLQRSVAMANSIC